MNKKYTTAVRSIGIIAFFVLGLCATVLLFAVLFMIKRNAGGFFNPEPYWIYPTLLFLLAGIITIPIAIVTIVPRMKAKSLPLISPKKKSLVSFSVFSSIVSIIFFAYMSWAIFTDSPPQFFPFDDPEATYTVIKRNDRYLLQYLSAGDMNAHQICTTNGCRTEVSRDIQVMIGTSKQPLEPFLNKAVKVDGNFDYSDQQCIAGSCQNIGRWAVLHLNAITEIIE